MSDLNNASKISIVIEYYKTEKKIECVDVTNVINKKNIQKYKDSIDSIKYFFWTKKNNFLFEVFGIDNANETCYCCLYNGTYMILQIGPTKITPKLKRILDSLINECVCMICSVGHFDMYACHDCQYMTCHKCLGKLLIQKFQNTGDKSEKCPQCRVVMKNLPLKLVYVNYEHPELSDVLTPEEKVAIKNADKTMAKKKKNKLKKIKQKMKKINQKTELIQALVDSSATTSSKDGIENKFIELTIDKLCTELDEDIVRSEAMVENFNADDLD